MPRRKLDLHKHYYPKIYFDKIRERPPEFSFDKSPSGQAIITYRGALLWCYVAADRRSAANRIQSSAQLSSIESLNIPESEKQRIFEGTALSILNNV